jgi:triacylglycerol lipase
MTASSDSPDAPSAPEAEAKAQADGKHWLKRAVHGIGRGARSVGRGAKFAWDERQQAVAALNGVLGDTLAERQGPLALKMALLTHDGSCALEETSDRVALGDLSAARRVCVFVHGSCESERMWWHPEAAYGAGLNEALGYAPLYLRYNSGLHISQNGQALVTTLDRLVAAHGTLEEIALIGHSMGGLVIRSACHYAAARAEGAPWLPLVRRIVFLGVPHDGAHLEQAGRLLSVVLSKVPTLTTRLLAGIGELRSDGIKDLRYGYLLEEEWANGGGELLLPTARQEVPLLPAVDYFIGVATLADDDGHWTARAFGDGLVHPTSATGEHWTGPGLGVPVENVRVFTGTSHLGLGHSRAVYDQLLEWLGR